MRAEDHLPPAHPGLDELLRLEGAFPDRRVGVVQLRGVDAVRPVPLAEDNADALWVPAIRPLAKATNIDLVPTAMNASWMNPRSAITGPSGNWHCGLRLADVAGDERPPGGGGNRHQIVTARCYHGRPDILFDEGARRH